MHSAENPSKLKKVINFILSLLTLLKWVPFLGKWRPIILALSTVLGTLSAIKCDPPANKKQPKEVPSAPTATPVRTPSPSPTPPPEIVLDRIPQAGWPFTVRYTAPFAYNTHLWADRYRLQVLGQDPRTGHMIAPAVTLNTAGRRKLTIRDLQGNVLAEKIIEVKP